MNSLQGLFQHNLPKAAIRIAVTERLNSTDTVEKVGISPSIADFVK
jgi:hypothetical protein